MYNGNRDNVAGQLRAYEHRDRIKPGDKFLWHVGNDRYMTSGRLPKHAIYCGEDYCAGDLVLTVIALFEGHNGYGNFVDYWMNESGEWDGTFNQITNKAVIINGPDAMRMEKIWA